MLSPRMEIILRSIVGQYIIKASPVPSHSLTETNELGVSSATIRNEMLHLEHEGYITRPHPSAGGVPLDKGYRSYVASLGDVKVPPEEQRLINHLFHQIELELDAWLDLAATVTAQKAQNMALISKPRPEASQFKRLDLVSLQDFLALVVVVLRGAKVRQQLIAFEDTVTQAELTVLAERLSDTYTGLTALQISAKSSGMESSERRVTDSVIKLIETEDNLERDESYFDGLHFTLNQPEFTHNSWLTKPLMELIEQRSLLKNIAPSRSAEKGVQVIIGTENKSEALRDYSVVISRYGLPDEAEGTICVIGPTRMPYARTIATVSFLSGVLSGLIAKLYGGEKYSPEITDN
jgi:heat-inducible transcriptional repressor